MPTCLIVDDSRIVRNVCRQIVSELGFTIDEAGDGQEALNYCNDKLPNLILLDWHMPVMDGMQFLEKFGEIEGNEKTKVIVCTTENAIHSIREALSHGAHEYVMKPFDREIIKNKLQQIGFIDADT